MVAEDRELDEGKIMLSGSVGEQDRKKIDEVLKSLRICWMAVMVDSLEGR